MNIKEREKTLDSEVSSILEHKGLIVSHIELIGRLMNILYSELSKYDFNFESIVGKSKIYNTEERMNFVKQFYTRHNIKFNVDEIINDGTLGFIYPESGSIYSETQYENETGKFSKYSPDLGGYQGFVNDKNLINIHNTGYIYDSVILAHEISHYRDQFKNSNQISDLFTETLAFVESIIMAKETLKNEEYDYYIKKSFFAFYHLSAINRIIYDFIILYKKLGYISYDNYCLLYGKIEYNDYLDKIERLFNQQFDIPNSARYTIAGLLVPFMLNKYEEDNKYFDTIQELHDIINNSDINTILGKIGLSNSEGSYVNKHNLNILIINLNDFLNENLEKGVGIVK